MAFYYAFRLADWGLLWAHLTAANQTFLFSAVCLTVASYLLRSRRWQYLFKGGDALSYIDSARVLILGFFMNNVLPARAGELVRAHLGSKVTGKTRTLVLATIASERLADGLTLSLMFVAFAFGLGGEKISQDLLYVAYLFLAVALGVALTLIFRNAIFRVLRSISDGSQGSAKHYILHRVEVFIEGLSPLFSKRRAPIISLYSIGVWLVELGAFVAITRAYQIDVGINFCVLFLVTVNFSSLIPSAPGGIGVIEALTSAVLIKLGTPRELALAMVITQHAIQYLVVGIPGAMVMLNWKKKVGVISEIPEGARS